MELILKSAPEEGEAASSTIPLDATQQTDEMGQATHFITDADRALDPSADLAVITGPNATINIDLSAY